MIHCLPPFVVTSTRSDTMQSSPSSVGVGACRICSQTTSTASTRMIACESCTLLYHLSCLSPPLTTAPKNYECATCKLFNDEADHNRRAPSPPLAAMRPARALRKDYALMSSGDDVFAGIDDDDNERDQLKRAVFAASAAASVRTKAPLAALSRELVSIDEDDSGDDDENDDFPIRRAAASGPPQLQRPVLLTRSHPRQRGCRCAVVTATPTPISAVCKKK